MEVINVQKESLAEVEILGHMALYTDLRVDRNTIPEKMYCYDLRHGDDDGYPAALEESVLVNYFGTVLMTDKLELEKGYLSVAYEDFAYTGEKMTVEEFLSKKKEPEPNFIQTPKELVEFLDAHDMLLHMTEKEADVLFRYMEGHGYLFAEKDGTLYRGDLRYEQGSIHLEEYSIDDAIDAACEWNYDLLQTAKAEKENPDNFLDFIKKSEYYESLREDEQVLYGMFDRTKYGKEVQVLAEKLADKVIQNLKQSEGIEKAAEIIADGIAQYQTGQEAREKMQYGEDIFEYQGYHFKPKRQFDSKTEDFFSVTRRLKTDTELGLFAADYNGKKKKQYSYEEFYKASTNKEADIFLCIENGKEYVPCQYELQEYVKKEPELKQQMRKAR